MEDDVKSIVLPRELGYSQICEFLKSKPFKMAPLSFRSYFEFLWQVSQNLKKLPVKARYLALLIYKTGACSASRNTEAKRLDLLDVELMPWLRHLFAYVEKVNLLTSPPLNTPYFPYLPYFSKLAFWRVENHFKKD